MAKYYLWCRAWPWYRPTFPFADFDALDDAAVVAELLRRAAEWDAANHALVAEHRLAERRDSDRKDAGQVMTELPRARKPPVDTEKAASFQEVAELAGWIDPPRGIVGGPQLGHLMPSPRVVIYVIDAPGWAEAIVDALREAVPVLRSKGFGGATVRLRYGVIASPEVSLTQSVLLGRAHDALISGQDPSVAWALPIVAEAKRIDALIWEEAEAAKADQAPLPEEDETAPPSSPTKPLSPTEARAHASYLWVLEKDPAFAAKKGRNYAEAYKRLKIAVEAGNCPLYANLKEVPGMQSWERYVCKGLSADADSRDPDEPRDRGGSVVEREDI